MVRLINVCISMLLIGACGIEGLKLGEQINYFHNVNIKNSKTRLLPSSYVECNDSFYWNTIEFEQSVALLSSKHPEHLGQMAVVAETPNMGPFRSGSSWHSGFDLTKNENETCFDIYKRITGDNGAFMEHRIYQSFDFDIVSSLIKISPDFQSIDAKTAVIENSAYEHDKKKVTDKLLYNVWIPVTVLCENQWLVKPDPKDAKRAIFKQPKGKCHFSADDYELELSSRQKMKIALRGFYEADPEYPTQCTLVHIERFGFKPISQ